MGVATDQGNQQASVQPTLLDLLVVFVCVGAVIIFLFWAAYRITGGSAFEDLPPWLVGSYGFFTALTTGSVGLGAAIIADLTRKGPRPNYVRLFIGSLLGALLLIAVITIVVSIANNYVNRTQPRQVAPIEVSSTFAKTFKLPDVSRNGTMREVQVSVRGSPGPQSGATFLLEYKWSGSGGTQNGSQGFSIVFKGKEDTTLGSFAFPLDRSHCYYGGGNYEQKSGTLAFDPRLIESIQILLTEVSGRMGAC